MILNELKIALATSRYRFWVYLWGTYLTGYTAGITSVNYFYSWSFFLTLIYFIFPANLYLYGINDLYDHDTDKFNIKKLGRENILSLSKLKIIKKLAVVSIIFSTIMFFIQPTFPAKLTFLTFLLLSYFYSTPPVRFKARPYFDFLSNILYLMPGLVGYFQNNNNLFDFKYLVAAASWIFAMHLFSAIPDISADKKANLKTTATVLGEKKSLYLVLLLWFTTALLIMVSSVPIFLKTMSLIYPAIPIYLLSNKLKNIKQIYWKFPLINMLCGFVLFIYLFLNIKL